MSDPEPALADLLAELRLLRREVVRLRDDLERERRRAAKARRVRR